MNRDLFLGEQPKAWMTDSGRVYRDKMLAEANTFTGDPKPLYLKPVPKKAQLLELANLWSPNDKLAQEYILKFAVKVFGAVDE